VLNYLLRGWMCTFSLQQASHVHSRDGASSKFSTNSHETDKSALWFLDGVVLGKIFITLFFFIRTRANLGLLNCSKLVFHVVLDAEVAPECYWWHIENNFLIHRNLRIYLFFIQIISLKFFHCDFIIHLFIAEEMLRTVPRIIILSLYKNLK
jgi:hypothetical protein